MPIDKTYVDGYHHKRGDVFRNSEGELIQLLGYVENREMWMCKPIVRGNDTRRRPFKFPGELATAWEYIGNFTVTLCRVTFKAVENFKDKSTRELLQEQADEISGHLKRAESHFRILSSKLNDIPPVLIPTPEVISMKNFDKYEVVEIRGNKGKDMSDDEIFTVIDAIKKEIKTRIDSGSYDSEKQKAKVKSLEEDVRNLIAYVDSREV